MRTEQEMMDLILNAARADERIRAVLLVGSRANPSVPRDIYQDYDITYFVEDIAPFYNNPAWVEERFGKPLIMQMPEAMRYPSGDGHFTYMMIFPDGVRLDLSLEYAPYKDVGEPAVVLLDKDHGRGFIPSQLAVSDQYWHISPPSPLFFYSCCNNFWWCLNNVAKGIARDELPYVMHMLHNAVRAELHDMIDYYIGVRHGFNRSTGKDGKYFKRYLPSELYEQYAATYAGSSYADTWAAIDRMCDLFHTLAVAVAAHFDFAYRQNEEDGMREYLRMVRAGDCEQETSEASRS
jgi:aminoglycoside 6-adenylyltransferase